MKKARDKFSRHVNITIPYNIKDKSILESVQSLAQSNAGRCRFIINIETSSGYLQRVVSQNLNVSPNIEFIENMRTLLGNQNVWINS